MKDVPLDQLTLNSFAPLLKTKFRVLLGSEAFELELTEAAPGRSLPRLELTGGGPPPESFSLIFTGPDSRFLPQRSYRFQHDHLGQFDLFMVPVGRAPGLFHYQVVFNRLA